MGVGEKSLKKFQDYLKINHSLQQAAFCDYRFSPLENLGGRTAATSGRDRARYWNENRKLLWMSHDPMSTVLTRDIGIPGNSDFAKKLMGIMGAVTAVDGRNNKKSIKDLQEMACPCF